MKFQLKKAALLSSLFLALFFAGFYIINLLDFRPVVKTPLKSQPVVDLQANEELKKKTGADGINFVEFEKWVKSNGLTGKEVYVADGDGDGLPNNLEYTHGTDPNKSDTDNDGYPDKKEIFYGYDPAAPGNSDIKPIVYVKIEKIGVDAPMVWSQSEDEKNSLKDLESGLSHFPESAAPGQNGNVIISGHSSNYVWAKGDYNYIFKELNNLEIGDIVNIKTIQKNGKVIMYKYRINDKFITTPIDERIFADTASPTLTLSTCWPVGTALKRTIIKADLVK